LNAPAAVLTNIDILVEPLEMALKKKAIAKENSGSGGVAPDVERANEMIKSCVKCMLAINKIEGATTLSRKWYEFVERIKKLEHVSIIIQAIENEKNFETMY
jgi:hypothetical protein